MIIYHDYPRNSMGIGRTASMMERHAPIRITFSNEPREAGTIIIHVHGERDRTRRKIAQLKARGQQYAIVQHVLHSSQRKRTADWEDIWNGARMVWSAYDLPKFCRDEGTPFSAPFYYAPYGGDPDVFTPSGAAQRFALGVCGESLNNESLSECLSAVRMTNCSLFHLGNAIAPEDGLVEARNRIEDKELAGWWSQCKRVAGLRAIEGFELPLVEGLFCGARPLTWDLPCYREWFNPWATFIPYSRDYNARVESIASVLRSEPSPVTFAERTHAAQFFNWQRIIRRFWEYL